MMPLAADCPRSLRRALVVAGAFALVAAPVAPGRSAASNAPTAPRGSAVVIGGRGITARARRPNQPTGLTLTGRTASTATISWAPSTSRNLAGYGVYRDGTRVASVTATTYTFTGLLCGRS